MSLVENWLPPSKEHWELVTTCFKYFPVVTLVQWALPNFYPAGKTSINSRINIPGRIGWVTMEAPGFLTLLYIMYTLPPQLGLSDLPWENKTMAGLFCIHYLYRAIISPLLNPSMSPMHPLVWVLGLGFQLMNATQIGGWLAGYGPTTKAEWMGYTLDYKSGGHMKLGFIIFVFGLLGNIFHEGELREIRRAAARNQKRRAEEAAESTGKGKAAEKPNVDKVYMIPQNGLFSYILYPHYLLEWIEWTGFWIIGGQNCIPARSFLFNEIATMLPRAVSGKQWYIKRFGKEKVGNRKAIVPGIL